MPVSKFSPRKCGNFFVVHDLNDRDSEPEDNCNFLNVTHISNQIHDFIFALLNRTSCCEVATPECSTDADCLPLPVGTTGGNCLDGECVYTNATIIY